MEGLTALPGVGPKMALIVLRVNHDITAGIAVDTHCGGELGHAV